MAISEQARKNHDELFPGHVSTVDEVTATPKSKQTS